MDDSDGLHAQASLPAVGVALLDDATLFGRDQCVLPCYVLGGLDTFKGGLPSGVSLVGAVSQEWSWLHMTSILSSLTMSRELKVGSSFRERFGGRP